MILRATKSLFREVLVTICLEKRSGLTIKSNFVHPYFLAERLSHYIIY